MLDLLDLWDLVVDLLGLWDLVVDLLGVWDLWDLYYGVRLVPTFTIVWDLLNLLSLWCEICETFTLTMMWDLWDFKFGAIGSNTYFLAHYVQCIVT